VTIDYQVDGLIAAGEGQAFLVRGNTIAYNIAEDRITQKNVFEYWVSVASERVLYYRNDATVFRRDGSIRRNCVFTVSLSYDGATVTAVCEATRYWNEGIQLDPPETCGATFTATADLLYLQNVMDRYPVSLPQIYHVGRTHRLFQPMFDATNLVWKEAYANPKILEISRITVKAGTFRAYHQVTEDWGGLEAYVALGSYKYVWAQSAGPGTTRYNLELVSYSHAP